MIMSVLGSMTGPEQGADEDRAPDLAPPEGATAGAGPSDVKDLGVVGRGKRRVQPVAVNSSPPPTQKRSLESLMGGVWGEQCAGISLVNTVSVVGGVVYMYTYNGYLLLREHSCIRQQPVCQCGAQWHTGRAYRIDAVAARGEKAQD